MSRTADTAKGRPSNADRLVAENLRRARLSAGVSMLALGRRIGVSHQLIARFEKGSVRIAAGYLPAIASALSVSIDDLFADAGSEVGQHVAGGRILPFMRDAAGITSRQDLEALAAVTRALADASAVLSSHGVSASEASDPASPAEVARRPTVSGNPP